MTDAGSTLVPDWLRQRARLTPARMALLCDGDHWTFAELEARALRTAAALASLGLKAGDHLGLLARNSPEFVQAVWGAISLRLVLVPLNTRLKATEVEYQVRDARIQVLVAGSEDWNTAQDVAEAMPGLRVLSLEEITGDEKVPAALNLAEMVDLTAVQGVMYTSGTTGQPKGAMLTYGNHFWSAAGSMLNLGLSDSDRWLVCLPLFHIGGLSTLFKSVIYGMTVVLHRTFDEGAVSRSLDEDGITAISVVATMLRRLLAVREGKPPPAALRCVLLGGGPIPPDLVDACLSSGLPVAPTYGLTESCSQATTLAPRDVSTRAASAGKPLFPVEVRIVDGAAIGLPEGAEGEILLRGPTITPGYLGRPEESDRLLAGGWLHTGDWGRVDSEGFLHVLIAATTS